MIVKIANNKSFTLAAKELFITQPTVSAYINNLEEELGARLFDRTTKEVELSEEGDRIYLYAKEMLELSDKIMPIGAKMYQQAEKDSKADKSDAKTAENKDGDEPVEGEVVDK